MWEWLTNAGIFAIYGFSERWCDCPKIAPSFAMILAFLAVFAVQTPC